MAVPDDIKEQFPIFGHMPEPFTYLDSAATTQKPASVLKALGHFYEHLNSNVHRSVYPLGEKATEAYEASRHAVARFVGADPQEIVFTKSATEAINLVAYAWGEANIREGDEIIATVLEHHSNFIPWQELARRKHAAFTVVSLDPTKPVRADDIAKKISKRTKLVAIAAISNVLGTVLPVEAITRAAHAAGARVMVDAAQSAGHMPTDVRKLGCDWLAFSGHKIYGPTGIGVLYGEKEVLETMPPFLFGGGMIRHVTAERSDWADAPQKFEAGTPPIAEAVALAAAVAFLETLGMENVAAHEEALSRYMFERLGDAKQLTVFGPQDAKHRAGIASFTVTGAHAHDIATLLGERGVCVRAGHHCAEPLHHLLGAPATCRASVGVYTTKEDIDRLADALADAARTLQL